MNTEKTARLTLVLNQLEQQWGRGIVRPLATVAPPTVTGVPTGFTALDALLGEGIPRGQTTELMGKLTSGMTTLAYRIVTHAQGDNAYAIYIDLDGTFDGDHAHRCGVDLNRLFLARPESEPDALDIARDLLESGSVGVIVLDLGDMIPGEQHMRRLARALTRSECVLLIMRLLGMDRTYQNHSQGSTALRLLVQRQAWIERQSDIRGYQSRVTVLKHKTAAGKSATIEIDFDNTINGEPE